MPSLGHLFLITRTNNRERGRTREVHSSVRLFFIIWSSFGLFLLLILFFLATTLAGTEFQLNPVFDLQGKEMKQTPAERTSRVLCVLMRTGGEREKRTLEGLRQREQTTKKKQARITVCENEDPSHRQTHARGSRVEEVRN